MKNRLRGGEGAATHGERGQVGRDGRWASGQGGLMVQARAVGGGIQAQAKPSRRASRVAIAPLVDGARKTKHLN